MRRSIFCALAVIVVLAASAYADIPKTINFQGRLTSPAGVPVDGDVDLILMIYNAGGTRLFSEKHLGVTVADGVFNVVIGSRTAGGVPSSVFSAEDRYVGLSVNGEPEMSPRLPLSSVPYAYVAEMAQSFEVPQSITASSSSTLMTLTNSGTGDAILGIGTAGKGVYGVSTGDWAVYAHSTNGPGAVYGQAGRVGAFAIKGAAVSNSGSTVGVMGEALNSAKGVGVVGNGSDRGVQGYAQLGYGVYGISVDTAGESYGGYFVGNSHFGGGVYGISSRGTAVHGEHTDPTLTNPAVFGDNPGSGDGVLGRATAEYSAAVHGQHGGAGPGGQFSSASGPAIVAEGDVYADRIVYNDPRTHYLRIGPCDCVPGSDEAYETGYGATGASIMHTGSGALVAGVQLPHMATVTKFTAYYYDGASGNLDISLERMYNTGTGWGEMAGVTSTGTPGYSNGNDASISNPVVNNLGYSYCVRIWSTSWPGDYSLRFLGAVVEYTIEEAD